MRLNSLWPLGLCLTTLAAAIGCGGGGTPGASPTADPSASPSASPSPTPVPTPTPTPGPLQAPAAPSGLSASASGGTAQLAWTDNATNETSYIVQDNASQLGWKTIATLPANAQSATVTNLDAGTQYGFRVVAANSVGASAPSNEASITLAPIGQANHNPGAPYAPNYVASLDGRYRWSKRALTYFLTLGPETRSEGAVAALVQQGAERWSTATGGLLTFSRTLDAASADIQVRFVAQNDPSIAAGGEEGLAEFNYVPGSPRNLFTDATISLKAGVPDGRLLSVVAHEFGHAIGISGHSTDAADTMAPVTRAANSVSARDANTIAFLYQTDDN